MLVKNEYHELKHELKNLCKPSIVSLCNDLDFDDYEKSLLMSFYNGMSRIEAGFKLHICESKYTKDLKTVFSKISDYLKRQV